MTVLSVEDLRISYRSRGEWREVVHNISFSIQRGEMLAFVGESGSGKTTTAQAIIGLLADNARRDAGRIVLNGEVISDWSDKRLNRLRGVSISLVPQDPGNSLNPVKTIGQQVEEILRLHQSLSAAERRQQALNLLAKVGLSHPEQRFDQYPHQLSGGMKQRVLIAIAIALQPDLIIADEPTSALDVTVQKRILDLLDILRRESGTAVLFVTHDLALAAERADRIMVFRQGEIQEQGATETIVQRPQHPYTRQLLHDLLDAPLGLAAARHRPLATPAIRVEGISKRFSLGKQALQALDSVSFEVRRGSTHALVGESGSGKTTLARILLGFERADAGQVIIDGIDAGHLSREAQRQLRRKIQFVYQNPFASLDPRQTLFAIIEEPLKNFERLSAATRRQRVESVAARVALAPELLSRTPRELSGGQRQRVAIARALILEPAILVLDEATSALDVTVQAQILALLQQLQQQLGLSYLFKADRRQRHGAARRPGGGAWRRKPPVRRPAAGLHPRTDRRHSPGFLPLSTGPHGERIMPKRLGFFTRLLDQGSAQTRYRLAAEQIRHAERLGFDSAWIAQHHFHEQEGGLPSPLVFLAHVAAQTDRIRLGTAIITLPMENPLRVAEDAAVLDLLTDGRLEVGFGSGGTPTSFLPFGLTSEQRGAAFADHLHLIHSAWRGDTLSHPDNRLYPPAPQLAERIWIATFSAEGAIRAGQAGHGLMLSRTQPRPPGEPRLPLDAIQNPIIDAYLSALPDGVAPRILASRTAFVADSHAHALQVAEPGLRKQATQHRAAGHTIEGDSVTDYLQQLDAHVGDPEHVIASLAQDSVLARATDISFQVHSVEPSHRDTLRSIELIAQHIAPHIR